MKKNLKRVLSVLLAAAMLLGMSVTSFAAENPDAGESQAILRGPARPITNVTLLSDDWNSVEKCYDFIIKEDGIGPGTVTFDGKQLMSYKTKHILAPGTREVIGWYLYYKSPRIYSPGNYRFEATFISSNGTPQIWKLKKSYDVTGDMLQ